MPSLPQCADNVSSSITAALLLVAIDHLRSLGLEHPTATSALEATGVSRARAYELKGRIEGMLAKLALPSGRPPKPKAAPIVDESVEVAREVIDYTFHHPGSVVAGQSRIRYSVGFRHFILERVESHPRLTVESFAQASRIPLGTLKDWLRGGCEGLLTEENKTRASKLGPAGPQIQTLLAEWDQWKGPFTAFCEHARLHCRLPFGKTLINRILEAHGVRIRSRRPGRSPDEKALRESFQTFFPHAQWVGDGTSVPIELDGELHLFNLEMNVDACSGAFLGAHVSDTEDSDAVIQTARDAIEETGKRPIALLLDNKPCNHTDEVKSELDDTIIIRATPFRGQNKAHIEGGFGLLKPTLEGLCLRASSPRGLAAAFLTALVITWGRTINHRPRPNRHGRSRAELLSEQPTSEQIQQARDALQARLQKQNKARETIAARQQPTVRKALADAYERLGLTDPDGHILTATARYPLESVVEAIAIFEGRKRANSLPDQADARYLLGIASNIAQERETWEIAMALWDARVAAGDAVAKLLDNQRAAIDATLTDNQQLLKSYVDHALNTPSRLDSFFWLTAAADLIRQYDDPRQGFRFAARRISAHHSLQNRKRQAAIRFLAAKALPIH